MEIIIVGCGKVGTTIAEQLSKEKHNITMIDLKPEKIAGISEEIDAIKVVGNGASITTLEEYGIETADMLIAVTGEDELNLLCCLVARKAGHCYTIARVRNPIYYSEINFIKEQLGISMIINPELAAATEISRILRFPQAIKIDPFAKGRVELLKFKCTEKCSLCGMSVVDMHTQLKIDILISAVERGNDIFIPDGTLVFEPGDRISILATPANSEEFFRKIGIVTTPIKTTMIVGGGTIGYYLAKQLEQSRIRVKIVEKDKNKCNDLIEKLDKTMIICGDGANRKILKEEGLEEVDSFVTLTNVDEENLLLAMYAKDNSNAKLVTKVNRIDFDEMISKMDIGSVVFPKYITADYILQYVRAIQNSIGNNVETLYHILDNRAEALEFIIREDMDIIGVQIKDLKLKKNLLIGCINRGGKIMIPRGMDTIEKGDSVIVVTTQEGLHDIKDILAK